MSDLIGLVLSGGWVMTTLLVLSVAIWAGIFSVYSSYSIDSNVYFKKIVLFKKQSKSSIEKALIAIEKELTINEKLIKSLIATAPLFGLLGTVGGMIETFSSLQTMEMFKPNGGISEGISQALLTTQLGLIVAVPALLFLKVLERKRKIFLEKLNEIVTVKKAEVFNEI